MPLKERIALGILFGILMYVAIIWAYRAGEESYKKKDKSGLTIDFLWSAERRYESLWLDEKEETILWHDRYMNLIKAK